MAGYRDCIPLDERRCRERKAVRNPEPVFKEVRGWMRLDTETKYSEAIGLWKWRGEVVMVG